MKLNLNVTFFDLRAFWGFFGNAIRQNMWNSGLVCYCLGMMCKVLQSRQYLHTMIFFNRPISLSDHWSENVAAANLLLIFLLFFSFKILPWMYADCCIFNWHVVCCSDDLKYPLFPNRGLSLSKKLSFPPTTYVFILFWSCTAKQTDPE